MKTYFDEETDKRLLEAQTEEEVRAIIAGTADAGKLADKIDLVMAELARIKGAVDNELDIDELDSAAGGAKRQDIYLSETQSCIATFFYEDYRAEEYCWSNDQCGFSNEYAYHCIQYSNCKKGGRHDWENGTFGFTNRRINNTTYHYGHRCKKCGLMIKENTCNFNY